MSVPNGRWLAPILALEAELLHCPASDRAARLQREAAARGLKPANLRRTLASARYVAQKVAENVIAQEEAVASSSAVERLMALERQSPADAVSVQADVLKGKISAMALLSMLKARSSRKDLQLLINDAIGLAEEAFETFESISVPSLPASPLRALFGVDVEVDLKDGKKAAVFYSPSYCRATLRGKPLKQVILTAFAAAACYDRVLVVLMEKKEPALFMTLREFLRDDVGVRISYIDCIQQP